MSAAQSAFVSYSRDDSDFALRLTQDLKAAGAHVWLDQTDINPGVPWDNAIEDALNQAPQMLLILSPQSARSENVRNEISYALEQGKIIIPVLYQDCVVPLRLQRTQRIDFRADYAGGLNHLLNHLRVVDSDPSILDKAREDDERRRAAWQAREAEAKRLREMPEREKADSDRKAHEEEQQRAEEQKRRAEEEQLRAEEEQLRARQERQREQEAEEKRHRDQLEEERLERERLQREMDATALREKQRKADLEAAERRKQYIRWAKIGGPVALLVMILVIYLAWPKPPVPTPSPDPPNPQQSVAPSAAAVDLYQQASDAGNRKDWTTAATLLDQSCAQGYAQGCMTLGYRYEIGLGTPNVDQVRAVALYQKACDEGSAVGCYHLGSHYSTGAGLSTGADAALARQTYQKGCSLGDGTSCTELKNLAAAPQTVGTATSAPSGNADQLNKQADDLYDQKNYTAAAPLYQQSCDLGKAVACTSLGYLYSNGYGVLKNPQTAVELYQRGCNGNDLMGCANLGNHIRDGDGSLASPQLAATYFEKACNGDYALACRSLGILYDNGSPIGVDLAKARALYQKACTLKDQPSCDAVKKMKTN